MIPVLTLTRPPYGGHVIVKGRCGLLRLHRTGLALPELSQTDVPQPVCRHCYPWPVGTLTVKPYLLNPLYVAEFIGASPCISYLILI